jgi:hypothetical protein
MSKSLLTKCLPLAVLLAALATAAPAPAAAAQVNPSVRGFGYFAVHYSLPFEQTRHLHNHWQAHRLVNFLRAVGCHAEVHHGDHCFIVCYHCHGSRIRYFTCDHEAHAFESRLVALGFSAHVHH